MSTEKRSSDHNAASGRTITDDQVVDATDTRCPTCGIRPATYFEGKTWAEMRPIP